MDDQEDGASDEEEEIFSWFSVVPEVGYLFFPKAEMTVNGFSATVEPRNGFIGKVHLDFGGSGLAFEAAPLFAVEAGGITPDAAAGFGSAPDILSSDNFYALGGQIALVYRFELGKFFPHLGLSFHGTYLMGNQIDYGAEIYGRIPVGFTVYMGNHIAFVLDAGFMYGATGIKTPFKMPDNLPEDVAWELEQLQSPEDYEAWFSDPNNQQRVNDYVRDHEDEFPENYNSQAMASDFVQDQLAESIRYGQGFGIDIMIGIRFP